MDICTRSWLLPKYNHKRGERDAAEVAALAVQSNSRTLRRRLSDSRDSNPMPVWSIVTCPARACRFRLRPRYG